MLGKKPSEPLPGEKNQGGGGLCHHRGDVVLRRAEDSRRPKALPRSQDVEEQFLPLKHRKAPLQHHPHGLPELLAAVNHRPRGVPLYRKTGGEGRQFLRGKVPEEKELGQ